MKALHPGYPINLCSPDAAYVIRGVYAQSTPDSIHYIRATF